MNSPFNKAAGRHEGGRRLDRGLEMLAARRRETVIRACRELLVRALQEGKTWADLTGDITELLSNINRKAIVPALNMLAKAEVRRVIREIEEGSDEPRRVVGTEAVDCERARAWLESNPEPSPIDAGVRRHEAQWWIDRPLKKNGPAGATAGPGESRL